MHERENRIREYFNMWVDKNFDRLEQIFDPQIYYSECYGPEYYGLAEIKQWIDKSMQKQTVLEWPIKQFIHQDKTVVVEWYFKDCVAKKEQAFDGVSIIEFTDANTIKSIKEFSSKAIHTRPFKTSK